ncbi:hypothetical protein T02_1408 [Trichinella nativa]|uniref:Uncharacterized protein n=1 Tax=Trichinella nativa TaxID=6335 RepID=A0A0V1KW82_9BILA|nr:hypothetical protein T02_1408 [Trichinella nativa]
MQISIAINDALSSVRVLRIEQRKSESADDTKQNKRRQEVYRMEQRKCENADDTKQNKRRQETSSLDEMETSETWKCRGVFCLSQVLFVMAFYRIVYILTEF